MGLRPILAGQFGQPTGLRPVSFGWRAGGEASWPAKWDEAKLHLVFVGLERSSRAPTKTKISEADLLDSAELNLERSGDLRLRLRPDLETQRSCVKGDRRSPVTCSPSGCHKQRRRRCVRNQAKRSFAKVLHGLRPCLRGGGPFRGPRPVSIRAGPEGPRPS